MRRIKTTPTKVANRQHGMGSLLLVTTGHAELYESKATIQDLLSVLADYSLETLFSVASKISCRLSSSVRGCSDHDLQLDIAGSILPPDALARLTAFLRGRSPSEGLVLFQERQLLTLLKIACLNLDPSAPQRAENAHGIGRMLLMVTDLLDEGIDSPLDTPEKLRQAELYFFSNYHFNSGRNPLQELGRTFTLYFEAEASGCIAQHLNRCTAGNPVELLAVLRAIHARFMTSQVKTLEEPAPCLAEDYFSKSLDFSLDESRRLIEHAGTSIESLVVEMRNTFSLEDLDSFNFLPFERYPLVGFGDKFCCPSHALLLQFLGLNFRHRLMDPSLFNKKERDNFLLAHGVAFHAYLRKQLDAAFPGLGYSDDDIEKIARLHGHKARTRRHGDYVVPYGDKALLFEFKAASPALRARTGRSWDELQRQTRETLIESARQLTATERLVQESGFDAISPDARIIPISVTLDFSVNPLLYASVARSLSQDRDVSERVARDIQFFDVRDAELLEHATHYHDRGLFTLLEEKLRVAKDISLANYCWERRLEFGNRHNRLLAAAFEQSNKLVNDYMEDHRRG